MNTLKLLGTINLILIALVFLCLFGVASDVTIGMFVLAALGVSVAQSIVGILKDNN